MAHRVRWDGTWWCKRSAVQPPLRRTGMPGLLWAVVNCSGAGIAHLTHRWNSSRTLINAQPGIRNFGYLAERSVVLIPGAVAFVHFNSAIQIRRLHPLAGDRLTLCGRTPTKLRGARFSGNFGHGFTLQTNFHAVISRSSGKALTLGASARSGPAILPQASAHNPCWTRY